MVLPKMGQYVFSRGFATTAQNKVIHSMALRHSGRICRRRFKRIFEVVGNKPSVSQRDNVMRERRVGLGCAKGNDSGAAKLLGFVPQWSLQLCITVTILKPQRARRGLRPQPMVGFGTQEDIRQENKGQENESQMDEGLCRLFSCRTCPSFSLQIFAKLEEINR